MQDEQVVVYKQLCELGYNVTLLPWRDNEAKVKNEGRSVMYSESGVQGRLNILSVCSSKTRIYYYFTTIYYALIVQLLQKFKIHLNSIILAYEYSY